MIKRDTANKEIYNTMKLKIMKAKKSRTKRLAGIILLVALSFIGIVPV